MTPKSPPEDRDRILDNADHDEIDHRLVDAGDIEAARLLHESALLSAKLRAQRDRGETLLAIPSLTPEQAERFRTRIAAAIRADRDSR